MKPRSILTSLCALQEPDETRPDTCVALRRFVATGLAMLSLCAGTSLASPAELGRLFYTPAQRDQLENARAHNVTQVASHPKRPSSPPPLRYDGVLMRSDGQTTRWVDGKAQVGPAAGVADLKPGQIRAGNKVYEPYQIVRPTPSNPAEPVARDTTP
jgi:hypothetical protein